MKKHNGPEHSLLAFSASPRWIPCPGSMAVPENLVQDADGGFYADEGTAAHTLASLILKSKSGMTAEDWIGKVIRGGKREFTIDEEFAMHVQTYVDEVKRRAIGGFMMVEQRVTLKDVDGFDDANYGTSDVIIGIRKGTEPPYGVVIDLKFGQGERVYAWERAPEGAPFTMEAYLDDEDDASTVVVPNYQLMMYAIAALADLRLLIDEVSGMLIVINQPRINNLSELWVPIAVLERFALFAAEAKAKAELAMGLGLDSIEKRDGEYYTLPIAKRGDYETWFNPGEKQCRWCKYAECPAAAKKVQEEAAAEFDVIDEVPALPVNTKQIAKAMKAIPFIAQWCKAVMARANEMVAGGASIIGPDGKPYKFVEGDLGDRKWADKTKAEAALVGQLADEAYAPRAILTAPAAAKKLDKKATKEIWKDVFAPMVVRAPGKPILVQGSDPRPAYSVASEADEFEDLGEEG